MDKKTKYFRKIQSIGVVPRPETAKSYNITKEEYLKHLEVYQSRGNKLTPLQESYHTILMSHYQEPSQIINVGEYRKKKAQLAQLYSIRAHGCIPSIKSAKRNKLTSQEFENALEKYLAHETNSLTQKRRRKLEELRKYYNQPAVPSNQELLTNLQNVLQLLRNGAPHG